MPRELIKKEIEIVAAGGANALSTTENFARYVVVTTGSVTLLANSNFGPSGNVTKGMFFEFDYVANIDANGNTITFFGEAMPDEYTNKDCYITCYYNGSAWEVKYFVSLNETGIVTPANFSISPYLLIDTIMPSAGIASTATLSEETLATLSVPGNTLAADGDMLKFVASGSTQANGNAKAIKLVSTSGGTLIVNTTSASPNGKDWIIEGYVVRNTATDASQTGTITISGSATDVDHTTGGGAYDWTGTETFTIKTTQGTATANNVILNSFQVYKIVA